MATPANQLDQLISTTYDNYRDQLADNVTKKTGLLAALESKSAVTESGGLTLRLPLMHALNNTVKSYSGYDLIDTTPQGGFGHAEYQWRQLAGAWTMSGEEMRKNAGPEQIISLMKAKFTQLELSFSKTVNTQFWATAVGNGGKDFLSIPIIIDDSGTLGGIDSATETWWKSVVGPATNLTTTAGVKSLNNTFNALAINGSKPDLEFTTQANFEAYEALALTNIRFVNTKLAELNFETLAHKSAEVVLEAEVPGTAGGNWYFINSERIRFTKHSDAWMKRLETQRPYNQDAYTAPVISMGQLVTDQRRAHGVNKNVVV